ncbi:hypothetical protein Sru01_20050 [Sphaerisporangium rufum]|uniref:2-hydroxyhepta-2,4-diene-1,7-dioate isomerase n=1 Tax=Sphaerisporangium rufum TaxID=1381558 RepID=A0A919V0R7_9ACTN|nr:fumarylacetoacetate hydrolase family protein [Sphaerisporangium rufum]GII77023.1 hypothetical protein Sru01_20050 [Sphaerisporangium rufum]
MRFGRVVHAGGTSYVEVREQTAIELECAPFGGVRPTGRAWPLDSVRPLAPVEPTKIIGVGRNYHTGAEPAVADPGEPLVFGKPPSSVIGPGAPIVLPAGAGQVDFEGEIAVVIGVRCRSVPRERALDVVFGCTIANDVTSREHQRSDGQWTRAKGYDSFCPLGPWVRAGFDASDVEVRTLLDGVVRQKERSSSMIHDIPTLVAWCSEVMTLEPGDVILSGTPAGTGPLAPGQEVVVEVDGLGALANPVVAG